jgi:uncharacterized protein YggE
MEESARCCGWSFKGILLTLVSVVFLMLFWNCISSPMIITFTGTGEVNVPATNASVSFSLLSSDVSAQGAIASVKEKAKLIKQVIIASGVPEEDILESQVTSAPAQTGGGYQALISMGAKTIHVANISDLIGTLYANGAAVVSQPTLSVENKADLEAKAVDDAMKDAKSQASKFALKNWKFFRKIVSISQQTSASTSTSTSKADAVSEATSQEAAANGVFEIVKAVSVSYEMW